MDILNSRHLTSQDSYLQLFSSAGEYLYYLTATPEGIKSAHESAFHLTVKPGKTKQGSGTQHDVKVNWDGNCYVPKPDRLEISVNDYVVWHCERMAGSPPFAVRGQSEGDSFSSSSMSATSAYTHFFLTPGEVKYQVSGKGSYLVRVADHRKVKDYERRAADAPVVTIRRGEASPRELDIVAGQTVIWAVEEGSEVSIASVR
ncbi:MAG: hypothetical protein U1E61_04890 [Bradyrhizobium sp.]